MLRAETVPALNWHQSLWLMRALQTISRSGGPVIARRTCLVAKGVLGWNGDQRALALLHLHHRLVQAVDHLACKQF